MSQLSEKSGESTALLLLTNKNFLKCTAPQKLDRKI